MRREMPRTESCDVLL